jgi:two-component system response regulator RegA
MLRSHCDRGERANASPSHRALDRNVVHSKPSAPHARALTRGRASVLVIEDDESHCDFIRDMLRGIGCDVTVATYATHGLAIARTNLFDLVLVDYRLPDLSGMDVLRMMVDERPGARVAVVSGFLTVSVAVEALKLGAVDVIEKPVTVDQVAALIERVTANGAQSTGVFHAATGEAEAEYNQRFPRSITERWVMHVLKGCHAEADLRTLEQWAHAAGVSYTSLCEHCRLLGIRPQYARDLTRCLRALIASATSECPPEVLLDVSDRRTLATLLRRAGSTFRGMASHPGVVEAFLREQQFVATDNPAMKTLLETFQKVTQRPASK